MSHLRYLAFHPIRIFIKRVAKLDGHVLDRGHDGFDLPRELRHLSAFGRDQVFTTGRPSANRAKGFGSRSAHSAIALSTSRGRVHRSSYLTRSTGAFQPWRIPHAGLVIGAPLEGADFHERAAIQGPASQAADRSTNGRLDGLELTNSAGRR